MAGHDGYTRYTVRIPTPLYERVKAAAGEKSVNAEIVAALEEAYPQKSNHQRALRNAVTMIIKAPAHMRRSMVNSMVDIIRNSTDDQYADRYEELMLASVTLAEEHEAEGPGMSDADIDAVLADMQGRWDAPSPDDD